MLHVAGMIALLSIVALASMMGATNAACPAGFSCAQSSGINPASKGGSSWSYFYVSALIHDAMILPDPPSSPVSLSVITSLGRHPCAPPSHLLPAQLLIQVHSLILLATLLLLPSWPLLLLLWPLLPLSWPLLPLSWPLPLPQSSRTSPATSTQRSPHPSPTPLPSDPTGLP